MKTFTVDAERFGSKLEMHAAFREVLGEENYWGSNLDALHDRLTMVFEPTTLRIIHWTSAVQNLGRYSDLLWLVLDDAQRESDNLKIIIE
jgi:RNAse (barnase) inhibitor barstar